MAEFFFFLARTDYDFDPDIKLKFLFASKFIHVETVQKVAYSTNHIHSTNLNAVI